MARGVIGRDATVESIIGALEAGRVAVVRGPGGIGKTAVLHEVVARWGHPSVFAAGIDFLGHQRLLPLERAVGHPLVGDLEAVASDVRSALDADGLAVIDSLQWADMDTLAVLPALAARGPLLLASRSVGESFEPGRGFVPLEALDPVVIDLAPLSDRESLDLLREIAPGLPARAVDDTVRLAAGNPLLLELLAHNQGALDPHGEDLVEALLLALPPDAIELLARLSVGLESSSGAAGADALVHAGMISRSRDGWCVLEAELLATRAMHVLDEPSRRALHLEAAGAADSLAVTAEHLLQAGDTAAAFHVAVEAVAEAEPDPPAALLLLALEVAPEEERWPFAERAALHLLLEGDVERAGDVAAAERAHGREDSRYDTLDAYVAIQRGDGARAVELLDRALEQAPPDLVPANLALRAGARASLFDVAGARDDATRSLELGAHGESAAAARFVLAGTSLLAGEDGWRVQLRCAVDEARGAGSRPLEVRAGITLAYGLFLSGERDEAVAVCRELIAAAAARRDEQSEFAIAKLLQAHLVFCDLAPRSVLVELDGLLRHPATRDDLTGGWTVAAIGWADCGELERAEEAVAHARREAMRAGPNGEVAASWALAELAWRQGSPAWCEEHARHGLDQAMMLNPAHANCASLVAWSQLELGRPVDVAVPYIPFPAAAGLAIEISAVQALSLGDHTGAADLFDQAQRRHDGYFRRSALRCQWGIAEAQRRAGDAEGALATLKDLEARCARGGFTSLDAHVAESIRRCDPGGSRARDRADGQVTARQLEVLSLVHGGLRTAEIADRLGLSPATVDTHIRGAMERLGVSSRTEAARRVFGADAAGPVARPEGRPDA